MFPFRQSIVFQQAQLPVIFTVDQCSFFFLTFQFWRNPWTKHPHNVKIFWLRYSTQSFVITKPWHCKNGNNYSSIITKNFIFGWNMLMKRAERERVSCRSVALRKILLVEIKFCTWGNGFSINFKWKVKKKPRPIEKMVHLFCVLGGLSFLSTVSLLIILASWGTRLGIPSTMGYAIPLSSQTSSFFSLSYLLKMIIKLILSVLLSLISTCNVYKSN